MISPERFMPSPHDETIQATYTAYRIGAHFLSPDGQRNLHFVPLETAGIAIAALESLQEAKTETSNSPRIAWLDLHGVKPEGRKIRLEAIGEPILATGYQEGQYSWAPLSELVANPELPLYTAEWLARFFKKAGNPSLTNSGRMRHPPFKELETKLPLSLSNFDKPT